MQRESIFIGLACFLGAGIGAWTSIELSTLYSWSHWLWPLGTLFGGIVGYLAYDPKSLWRGISDAFNEVVAWRPNYIRWKAVFFSTVCLEATAVCWISVVVISSTYFQWESPTLSTADAVLMVAERCLYVAMFVALLSLFFGFLNKGRLINEREFAYRRRMIKTIRGNKMGARLCNPLSVTYFALKGLWFILPRLPQWGVNSFRAIPALTSVLLLLVQIFLAFCWRAFHYVHSDRRTLCLVDSAIGGAVGFYLGNPLIGAIVGCIFGIANYELISVRWLRIVPRNTA